MYLTNPGNIVQALDASTGDVIWQYAREFPEGVSLAGFNQLRNISIYEDKVLLSTKDAALVALNARTGDVVWEHQIADPALGYSNVSGPLVTGGIVVNGINGCSRFVEDSCFITAHDPDTGAELWRTYTVARPGDPGGVIRGATCRWSFAVAATRGYPGVTTPTSTSSTGQRPRQSPGSPPAAV